MEQSAGLEVVSHERFCEFMEVTHRHSQYSMRMVDYRNGDSGKEFRLDGRAIAEIRLTKACGKVYLIEKKVEVPDPQPVVTHYVNASESGIVIMPSETVMRTELFTQLIVNGVEKPPVCVFLDDGTTLPVAFDRVRQAYGVIYANAAWLAALQHELPGYAEVLDEVGTSKMKTDITPELTIAFYVQTVPMTRFV